MREKQLSDLSVIAMNYIERIPVDEVCHVFIQASTRHLFKASLFEDIPHLRLHFEDIITHN